MRVSSQRPMRDVASVSTRYSTPAVKKNSIGRYDVDALTCTVRISSVTATVEIRAEFLMMFLAQFGQHGGGGDVAVPLGAALMRRVREDGRGHPADLVVGQGVVAAQRRGMGGETGCELHGLSPDKKRFAVHTAHRIPRFGAQPFGCLVRSARGTRLALLPPSFLSSSPATKGSARTEAIKETSAGLVRPAGAAEDTALRALKAYGRGLQSRTR